MGHSEEQLADLAATIKATPCDIVVVGTPIDLTHLLDLDVPSVRVTYAIEDVSSPTLGNVIGEFISGRGLG